MGIRVKKMIGYGLDNVVNDGKRITDDRFFDMGYAKSDMWSDEIWTTDDYFKYCRSIAGDNYMLKSIDYIRRDYPYLDVLDSVIYNSEYGLSNIFMIIPPESRGRWIRYDNDIDYAEETAIYKQKNRYEFLNRPIYPYVSYIDKREGRSLPFNYAIELIRIKGSIINDDWYEVDQHLVQSIAILSDDLAKKCGFSGYHDFLDNYNYAIPESVVALCKWLNLFTDENTVYQLQPMLYVYWS